MNGILIKFELVDIVIKYCKIGKDDFWPEAVCDGLSLSCGICGVSPVIDYLISDEIWKKVVPKELRLDVVCLGCLVLIDPNVITNIKRISICGGGQTLICLPEILYDYRETNIITT